MATSTDGEGRDDEAGEAWLDALAAVFEDEQGAAALDDLRRAVEVATRILAMREAGERHATVQAARSIPLGTVIEQLGDSLDTLGLSVVESGRGLGIVAETAASLATRVPAAAAAGQLGDDSEDFATLCRAQSGALTSMLSAMQGNGELAKQARVQLSVLARSAAQTEQRLRLAKAAEVAVVDSIEQVLAALRRLA